MNKQMVLLPVGPDEILVDVDTACIAYRAWTGGDPDQTYGLGQTPADAIEALLAREADAAA